MPEDTPGTPPAPVDPALWDRYRFKAWKARAASDYRLWWTLESREKLAWDDLTRGERRMRDRFARLISRGASPLAAISDVLGIADGPIPELQTLEDFLAHWTPDHLTVVANRWLQSPYFRNFSRAEVAAAHTALGAAAKIFASTLIEIAADPTARAADRVAAASKGLGMLGVVAGSKIEDQAADKKTALQKRAAEALLRPNFGAGKDASNG